MNSPHPRPLSPHLQVYKLPLTGLLSISHRITGVLLAAGLLYVVWILCMLASGPDAYAAMQAVAGSRWAKPVTWGFLFALFFHLCHGVRHLIWDTGRGLEAETLNRHGWIELAVSVVLTLAAFFLI